MRTEFENNTLTIDLISKRINTEKIVARLEEGNIDSLEQIVDLFQLEAMISFARQARDIKKQPSYKVSPNVSDMRPRFLRSLRSEKDNVPSSVEYHSKTLDGAIREMRWLDPERVRDTIIYRGFHDTLTKDDLIISGLYVHVFSSEASIRFRSDAANVDRKITFAERR